MPSYDGTGMWGAIGQTVGAVGNIWSTSKTAQLTADALNKESEINDRSFQYSLVKADQQTKSIIQVLTVAGVIVVVAIIALSIFKKKS